MSWVNLIQLVFLQDEVERSVREVNEMLGEMHNMGASQIVDAAAPITRRGVLTIDHRALNPNNELRRIFGVKIFQNEQV